jgi:hypothetical protein
VPIEVRLSVLLLGIAWCISVGALAAHLRAGGGFHLDTYTLAGVAMAAVQAVLIFFISKRNNVARLIVLWAAVPAFLVVFMNFAGGISALRLGVETALRAGALVLLLTREAADWFKGAQRLG